MVPPVAAARRRSTRTARGSNRCSRPWWCHRPRCCPPGRRAAVGGGLPRCVVQSGCRMRSASSATASRRGTTGDLRMRCTSGSGSGEGLCGGDSERVAEPTGGQPGLVGRSGAQVGTADDDGAVGPVQHRAGRGHDQAGLTVDETVGRRGARRSGSRREAPRVARARPAGPRARCGSRVRAASASRRSRRSRRRRPGQARADRPRSCRGSARRAAACARRRSSPSTTSRKPSGISTPPSSSSQRSRLPSPPRVRSLPTRPASRSCRAAGSSGSVCVMVSPPAGTRLRALPAHGPVAVSCRRRKQSYPEQAEYGERRRRRARQRQRVARQHR